MWGGPDEIECLGSGPVGLVTSAVGEGLGPPLQGRDVVWALTRGVSPGLLEAALQAACLWELICGGGVPSSSAADSPRSVCRSGTPHRDDPTWSTALPPSCHAA